MDELYNSYYNSFLQAALKRLKPEFGAQIVFYPFTDGVLINVELKRGQPHKMEKRGMSLDLVDALIKTRMIDKSKRNLLKGKAIVGTLITIPSIVSYLIFKDNTPNQYSNEQAQKDFDVILNKVITQYGNGEE